jgi:hypothetical protein
VVDGVHQVPVGDPGLPDGPAVDERQPAVDVVVLGNLGEEHDPEHGDDDPEQDVGAVLGEHRRHGVAADPTRAGGGLTSICQRRHELDIVHFDQECTGRWWGPDPTNVGRTTSTFRRGTSTKVQVSPSITQGDTSRGCPSRSISLA